MDQIMTWILKLIRYWLNVEQVHHRPRKYMELFVVSGDFGFQDQMYYISIHQPVRKDLGLIVHLFADEISHYLYVSVYSEHHLFDFPRSVSLCWCCLYFSCEYISLFHYLVPFPPCVQLWTFIHSALYPKVNR